MKKKENQIKYIFNKIRRFFKKDIWEIDNASMKLPYKALVNIYRILALTVKDFIKDKCALWASTLTYNVVLSFVPITAVVFFITKIFNLYDSILPVLLSSIERYAPKYEPFLRQIFSFAENVNISNYGTIGIGATIVSMVLLLMNVQKCLTSIWNVKYKASFPRQVADYTALLILIPVMIGLSLSLIAYSSIAVHFLPYIVRIMLSTIAPIILLWLIILLLYVLIPATKVLWKGAAVSSILAAAAIIVILNIYFKFNIGAEKYENIFDNQVNNVEYKLSYIDIDGIKNYTNYIASASYRPLIVMTRSFYTRDTNKSSSKPVDIQTSSMAFSRISPVALEQFSKYNFKINDNVIATYNMNTLSSIIPQTISFTKAFVQIPVLLLLIYVCWAIMLFGAEMNNAYQQLTLYDKDISDFEMSYIEKEIIALSMLTDIARNFVKKEHALSMSFLAMKYKISLEHVSSILMYFEQAGYILSFADKGKRKTYMLSCPPESIKISAVIETIRNYGESGRVSGFVSEYYVKMFEKLKKSVEKDLKNMSIKDAINASK